MKNILEFEFDTTMDINLVSTWQEWENYRSSLINWVEFVYTLPHIVSVDVTPTDTDNKTIIEFDSEEAKTWFILRWS